MLVVSELSRLVWISEVVSILGLENLAAGAETELKREWQRVNSISMIHKSKEWDKCWEKETFLPLFLVFLIHSFLSHKSYMQDHSSYFCMKYHRTPIFNPKKKKIYLDTHFSSSRSQNDIFFHICITSIFLHVYSKIEKRQHIFCACDCWNLLLSEPKHMLPTHVLCRCASTKSGLVNEPNKVHLFETPLSILVT